MKPLTNGSKNFYQWINSVKAAKKSLDSLYSKKDYYETKFYSVRTMTYEPFRGSNYQDKDMKMYWMIKIDEVEQKISKSLTLIHAYQTFHTNLNEAERSVIDAILREHISFTALAKEMKVSRTRIYEIRDYIIRKHSKR